MTTDPIIELAEGLTHRLYEGLLGLDAPERAIAALEVDLYEGLRQQVFHSQTTSPLMAAVSRPTYTESYFRARTNKLMVFLMARYGRIVWDVLNEARYSLFVALVVAHQQTGLITERKRIALMLTYADLRWLAGSWLTTHRNN